MELTMDNIPKIYPDIINHILISGHEAKPRGGKTKEVLGLYIISENPRKRFFLHPNRDANPVFSIAELLWYLHGDSKVDTIAFYVTQMMKYASPFTGTFHGAYGPRIMQYAGTINQLDVIYHRLKVDPDSRRAICVIYNPQLDWSEEKLDIPCNISLQFLLRDKKLNMFVYTRSQDMIKGFVYDTEEWQLLQEILAGWLNVDVGRYHHFIASAHIYQYDFDLANKVAKELDFDFYKHFKPLDARLTREETQKMFPLFFKIERKARKGQFGGIERILDRISNDFWRSSMASIVAYCTWKHKQKNRFDNFFSYVQNELSQRLEQWLKKRKFK